MTRPAPVTGDHVTVSGVDYHVAHHLLVQSEAEPGVIHLHLVLRPTNPEPAEDPDGH